MLKKLKINIMNHLSDKLLLFLAFILLYACQKEKPSLPVITTKGVTGISYTTAISGGNVTNDGGTPVLSKGVCWSVNAEPTVADNTTIESGGPGEFTSNVTHLAPNAKYYIRAYAINNLGTGYGIPIPFMTLKTGIPVITTTPISSITGVSAISGGNISDDCGSTVKERGICWGISTSPTTHDNRSSEGSGGGGFTSTITGLLPNTTYYVRAYATNDEGTAYGSEINFTTNTILSILTTTTTSSISSTSCESGGNISDNGGALVTERGICWSTSQNPTISDNKIICSSVNGSFSASLSGLMGSTKYYIRAYAINSAGVAYGNEVNFTTNAPTLPTLSTTGVTSITISSAISGGSILNDGGSAITVRGICWSTSENPTTASSKTTDSFGSGTFVSNITGLEPNTLYYLRAYSTNSVGTMYGNELIVRTYNSTVTDVDGNIYYTIIIGTQTWMAGDLKTTKYRNGDPIGTTSPATLDISTEVAPKYQWAYDGAESNVAVYGRLYTWFAATDNRNVCPVGWHLASDSEWTTMQDYLNANGYNYDGTTTYTTYNKIGKSLASTSLWRLIGTQGSIGNVDYPTYRNKSGFSSIPGGVRAFNGIFFDKGNVDYWWTATEIDASFAWIRNMYYSNTNINDRVGNQKNDLALSLRCIKDN